MVNRAFDPGVPGVIEALRDATRSRHARLAASSAMVRLFDSAYTVSEYRTHLGRLLGLFEPLERAVADATDPADPGYAIQRSRDLREDLHIMGATAKEIDALERCHQLPPIVSAGLAGYTYVILGSMLGGKIIVERLRAVLGPDASFLFYGDANGRSEAVWASFRSELEESGESDVPMICATAVGIFDAYAAWLSDPPRLAGGR
ncbi:MAG: biliverdin-producing heme oxygenase [Candidatus Acidiferrales bacterium]|jgi:heme oxygenase